ncbi:hypothetical protein V8C86DRAFT_2440705 [Haematococcus lacustris]
MEATDSWNVNANSETAGTMDAVSHCSQLPGQAAQVTVKIGATTAFNAVGWHDQPPDTEMQDTHVVMQADKQHAPQPHHHLPALTAAAPPPPASPDRCSCRVLASLKMHDD